MSAQIRQRGDQPAGTARRGQPQRRLRVLVERDRPAIRHDEEAAAGPENLRQEVAREVRHGSIVPTAGDGAAPRRRPTHHSSAQQHRD